jgi:CheY-like chemotaxis protein
VRHDASLHKALALVIDGNANTRSLISAQLREIGIGSVRGVARARDARYVLENAPYDIVVCESDFPEGEDSGQELLDELRREQLLPYSTVFIMLTAEASYAKVAEAAETALDGFLIKPFNLNALAERIHTARHRKKILGPIFEAIEARDFEKGAKLCLQRFESKQEFWLFAARIGAELLLRLGRHDDARTLYEAIIAAKTLPWAKLGVGRVELESGQLAQARRTLEALVGEQPGFADSYDVLGRVHLEQGDLAAALATYRQAADLTPGCLMRLQRAGTLSFYAGDREAALKSLDRAVTTGLKSKLFDPFSLLLAALMRFDKGDARGLKAAQEDMARLMEKATLPARVERLGDGIDGLVALLDKQSAAALEIARRLARELDAEDADVESASIVVALWIRLARSDLQLPEMAELLQRTGLRYCVNKAATEMLVALCEDNEAACEALRGAHARIFEVAETAMKQSLRGQAGAGVELLMQQGEKTRNAKLIDMAMSVLKRHAEKIDNAAALEQGIAALQARYVKPMSTSVGRARAAGGLALRGAES